MSRAKQLQAIIDQSRQASAAVENSTKRYSELMETFIGQSFVGDVSGMEETRLALHVTLDVSLDGLNTGNVLARSLKNV